MELFQFPDYPGISLLRCAPVFGIAHRRGNGQLSLSPMTTSTTSSCLQSDMERARELGATVYRFKPASLQDLGELVRTIHTRRLAECPTVEPALRPTVRLLNPRSQEELNQR